MRRILFVRHGESAWNAEGRWQGWIDAPLTPRGEAQGRARGRAIAAGGARIAAIWTSDLQRARDTAAILGAELGVPVTSNPGLRERHGGDWQGHTGDEIEQRWPGMRAAWWRDEIASPPGGESDAQVLGRVDAALARVDAESPAGDALVVTHGGVLHMVSRRAGVEREPRIVHNLGGHWFTWSGGTLVAGDALPDLPDDDVEQAAVE